MFPRARHLTAAAALLAAAASPVLAAMPAPSLTAVSTGSINVSWTGGAAPYVAVLSTSPSFAGCVASGTVSGNATGYPLLAPDTTYYFKVKTAADPDTLYSSVITTATWVAAPSALFSLPAYFTADSSFTATARLGWDTGGNPEWTRYELFYDKSASFASAGQTLLGYPPVTLGGLEANTTYYFKVRAFGSGGTRTPFTPPISTATLALALSGIEEDVRETSATVSWTAVNGGPAQALYSEGYRLKLSGDPLLSSLATDWSTADKTVSSAAAVSLQRNTTYYYKVGSLNWSGSENLSELRSFTTLSAAPQGLSRISVVDGGATLGWAAMGPAEAIGYRLEASTDGFATPGLYESSATYAVQLSTLSINTLYPNTTYYFRAGSLNKANAPNYGTYLSSVTLALPVSAALTASYADPQRITVSFTPLPASPQAFACEGYRLEGSSAPFGSGATVFSSATYAYQDGLRTLAIGGLRPNTTHYLRLATLNWERTPNYSLLPSTATGFPGQLSGVALNGVWSSSAAISFTPGTAAEGHVAEASVYRFFTAIAASSATPSATASGLVINGLDPNTTYYFRAGALYNGATIYTNTDVPYKQTLPQPLSGLAYPEVYQSSVTVSWTPLAVSPQSASAEGYLLQADTSPAFASPAFSSATYSIQLDRLAIEGLSPNTSYYFRAGTVNMEGSINYAAMAATATMANPPVEQGFSITSLTLNLRWSSNSNPPDTRYLVEMDDDPAYGSPQTSSTTVLSSATFSGLIPNTTYYSRVTAINRRGRATPAVDFSPTATGAYDPVAGVYSGIGASSVTLNWGRGANPAGVTYYTAYVSSNSDFSGTVNSSTTLSLSSTFYGLQSDTSYYLRVSALNLAGLPTDPPVSLGSALTLPATAYRLSQEETFTGMLTDGFTANWGPNGNSSSTIYNVQVSTDDTFLVYSSSCLARGLSCAFSGLAIDTTYYLQVQAIGQGGVKTAFIAAGSTITLLSSNVNALAQDGALVTLETSYGQISVLIPPGAIGSSTRLTLTPSTSTLPAPDSAVSALTPTGIGLTLNHFPPTLVLGAITITLPYRPADLPAGIDASRLVLALYDEDNRVWVPLPSVSDTARSRVIGQTWHLSTFQIMQSNPPAGLGAVKIYPNPFRPSSVTGVMNFAGLPPYARVKIYTFLGELVRSLKADVNGMTHWDGRNDSGNKAASGVYIAFIQTGDKKSSKSFKVALER
ncbi:MAG: fibronectin type III domain-containing protein [Elusimicrobia bacterium]|nr:fibronectin type III domain-containing protein [Elusimicrobiota bacterium]